MEKITKKMTKKMKKKKMRSGNMMLMLNLLGILHLILAPLVKNTPAVTQRLLMKRSLKLFSIVQFPFQ